MQEERKLQMQQQSEGKTFIKTSRGKEIIAITIICCGKHNNGKAILSSAVLTLSNAVALTYCLTYPVWRKPRKAFQYSFSLGFIPTDKKVK